jgi:hypothetical protein
MSKLDIDVLRKALREHFATVTKEEFLENLREWTPEFFEDDEPVNGTPPAKAAPSANGTATTNDDVPRESV